MATNNTSTEETSVIMTLLDTFKLGWKKYKQLDDLPSSSTEEFQSKAKEVVKLLENATRMVSELSLYSLNEEFDEISTTNIRFLLLPFLLANTSERLKTDSRIDSLEIVESYYKNFLGLCKSYDVMEFEIPDNKTETKQLETKPSLEEMTRNRDCKIKRYKEKKAQEELLCELEKTVRISSNGDEELERKYYVILLKNHINKALDELENIHMEKSMLLQMKTRKDDNLVENENSSKLINKKPLKPIIITRNALQKQVYGLGYPSFPTMTIDEFYEERLKEPGDTEIDKTLSLMAKAMAGVNREEERESDAIQAEIAAETDNVDELKRLRGWDDWKDDHRRGFGNRKNRS